MGGNKAVIYIYYTIINYTVLYFEIHCTIRIRYCKLPVEWAVSGQPWPTSYMHPVQGCRCRLGCTFRTFKIVSTMLRSTVVCSRSQVSSVTFVRFKKGIIQYEYYKRSLSNPSFQLWRPLWIMNHYRMNIQVSQSQATVQNAEICRVQPSLHPAGVLAQSRGRMYMSM